MYGVDSRFNWPNVVAGSHCRNSATYIIFLLCKEDARFLVLPYRQTEVRPSGSYVVGWKLADHA